MPHSNQCLRALNDLDPPSLTALLAENGLLQGERVVAARVEPIGEGRGFIGEVARLHLTYSARSPHLPATVIAKLPTLEAGGREIGRSFGQYAREIEFYRHAAGALGALSAPRHVASRLDASRDEFVLLIEDVGAKKLCDQAAGLTPDVAEAVLIALASMHERWWGAPGLTEAEWLPAIDAPLFRAGAALYARCWPVYLEHCGAWIGPGARQVGHRLAEDIGALFDRLGRAPPTLVHGDLRGDNVFIDASAAAVTVVDWQMCVRGPGAFDVAYFLATSLAPDTYAAHATRLIEAWRASLGVAGYEAAMAARDVAAGLAYTLVYAVVGGVSAQLAIPSGRKLLEANARRISAALELVG